jgi:hypothetical protein
MEIFCVRMELQKEGGGVIGAKKKRKIYALLRKREGIGSMQ